MQMNCDKIMHACWDFDASNVHTQSECIGQASKLKQKCIILQNSQAQSNYAVINLIHSQTNFLSYLYVINKTFY